MTLITAVQCTSGILLTADKEENTPYGGKRAVSKLFTTSQQGVWTLVVGTAGSASVGDVAVKRIRNAALDDSNFVANHEHTISNVLSDVYKKHVPDPNDPDRAIQLIVAVNDETTFNQFLYKTDREILQPEVKYTCTGVGQEFAYYFLDRLWDIFLSPEELVKMMAFVMREANASVGSVGLGSEFRFLQKLGTPPIVSVPVDELNALPHLKDVLTKFWKDKQS